MISVRLLSHLHRGGLPIPAAAAAIALALAGAVAAQTAPPPVAPAPAAPQDVIEDDEGRTVLIMRETEAIKALMEEVKQLRDELQQVRAQLAAVKLTSTQAERELAELRQFVRDHREYGDDFARYQGVVEVTEREARQRAAEEARNRRDAEKAMRDARRRDAVAVRAAQNAKSDEVARYRRSGFSPLGLDVFSSKMAFFYETKDSQRTRVDYDPLLGNYLRPYPTTTEVDYSNMTISGSVLNAGDGVRNIGVAITFFDENGNQVGHEIVQVNNARPDVPYPFTSTLEMALNRPFDSSSIYVLYADPADESAGDEEPEGDVMVPEKDQPSRYGTP